VRIEGSYRIGRHAAQRNAHLNPSLRGNVSGKLADGNARGKTALDVVQPQARQRSNRNRCVRVQPERKRVASKQNLPVTKIQHTHGSNPGAAAAGLPRNSQRVGRREKKLGIEGKPLAIHLQRAGRDDFSGGISVGRGVGPVVKKSVLVIGGLGWHRGGGSQNQECQSGSANVAGANSEPARAKCAQRIRFID